MIAMKSNLYIALTAVVLFTVAAFAPGIYAQPSPVAQSSHTEHGISMNQSPSGIARVGDGVSILIAFALAYSYKRIRQKKRKTSSLIENQEGK